MNKASLKVWGLMSWIGVVCTTTSIAQNVGVNSSKTGWFEKVDSVVIHKMNQYEIPGLSIGLVRNDSIIYAKGYGVRNIESNVFITEHSVFHTASISKLFTALAITKLTEQNVLGLDDQLIDILPGLNYRDKRVEEITIRTLLNHTSGLPDIHNYHWENNHQSDHSLEEYILGLDLKLESIPSSEYAYSNLGYDILGYVIEKVAGFTFDDYVKDNILEENEMYNSDFRYFKISDSLKTSPHSKSRLTNNIYSRKTYPYTREHAPSSTLNSSAADLSKWMVHFFDDLDSDSSKYLYRKMIEPSSKANKNIGLGFQLYEIEGKKAVGHFGGDQGFRSFLMMIPKEKIGLVLLSNCDYHEDFRQEIIYPLAKLMLFQIARSTYK